MIAITKLNDREIIINSDLIESLESTPDSTITMTTGKKFIAKESIDDIIEKVVAFKQKIYIGVK